QSRRVGRTRIWAVSGTDSTSALIVVDQWATKFGFVPSPLQFSAIGEQVTLDVQLRDASGNAIPSAIRRTTQCRPRDTLVVQLDAASKVRSRANGVTWIRCADRGISDSVRVEVAQRPARALIVDKLSIGTKNVPDTFRLKMRAVDSKGENIPSIRPTWASLNPNMVTIDPVSGLARAVGPGTARIVTQVADATDTLTVSITGTALATTEATAVGPSEITAKTPTLTIEPVSLVLGDTARLVIRATDALGQAIQNPEINTQIRSSADSVVKYVGKQKILPVSLGTAWIIAQLGVNGITVKESIQVSPRAKGNDKSVAAAVGRGSVIAFVRPVRDTAGARARNADSIRIKMQAIVNSGIGKPTSGRTLAFEGIAATAKHATKLSSTVAESRSGLLFGGTAYGSPVRWLTLSGTYRTGTLTAKEGGGEDMGVTEVDGQVSIWPLPWFSIGGGYMLRGESTSLSIARWSAANVTAQFKGSYVGDFVSPVVGISFFPVSKFSGDSIAPSISSLAGEAGLDFRLGYVSVGFRYYIENFLFPVDPLTNEQRTDQFSTLRLRIGAKFGH
ncbi:MAG TPA: hypothetical protein VF483_04955, partial [Gemmatimonadaceae bacterium]